MHRQNGTSGRDQDHFGSAVTLGDWHTHAMEWTPNRCEFFIDGKSIGKSTSRIPNTPMRFVCQNETELNSTYPAHAAVPRVAVKDDRLLRENPCRMRGVRQGADIGAPDGVWGTIATLTRHPTIGSGQAAELSLSGSVCQARCSL
jgi:Glycosyl hydrolases family 16